MAATATELSSQAEQLQNAVGFFKLEGAGRPAFRAPAPVAKPPPPARTAPSARPRVIRQANAHARDNAHIAGHLASGPGGGPSRGGPGAGNGIDLDLGAAPSTSDDAMFERY
jgi:hypothetical protein